MPDSENQRRMKHILSGLLHKFMFGRDINGHEAEGARMFAEFLLLQMFPTDGSAPVSIMHPSFEQWKKDLIAPYIDYKDDPTRAGNRGRS